jgi:hypothetical protein
VHSTCPGGANAGSEALDEQVRDASRRPPTDQLWITERLQARNAANSIHSLCRMIESDTRVATWHYLGQALA